MRLSHRTIAKVETWIDKQKTSKLRKYLVEGWITEHEPRDIEDLTDEEVRNLMKEELLQDNDDIASVLETIGIEAEYSDEEIDADDDSDDDDDIEEE
jgi:hypothetical protein